MSVKTFIKRIRYGGIFKVVENQTDRIHELERLSVSMYNIIFEIKHGKMDNQSEYHGPMSALKDCRVISSETPNKKFAKNMIEVAEFNGFNGATYYWYFAKEAKLIHDKIDFVPEKEEGETYIPKVSRGSSIQTSQIKTHGKIMDPEYDKK